MKPLSILALSACFLASCQSMSEGVIGLEGHATIFDDQSSDLGDVDVQAYGARLTLNTPIVDILGGVDMREYGDADTPELLVGARRRFLEIWRIHPFVEANLRYGLDLDTGMVEDSYFGYNAGAGIMLDLTDNMYLTARAMYETVEISTAGGDVTTDGVVGIIGLGIHF